MTTPSEDEILALAKKATLLPWEHTDGVVWIDTREQVCCGRSYYECCGQPDIRGGQEKIADSSPINAAYIAAANPAAIIALIERHRAALRELEIELEHARGIHQDIFDGLRVRLAAAEAEVARLTRRNEELGQACAEFERRVSADYQRDLIADLEARAKAAESALAAVSDDGADRVISDLLIASAPYADMDETGRLPKAREQAERLLNEPDLSAKQRYANHYEEQIGFLVERFAEALSSKLRKAEEKYQYQGAWRRDSWHDALVQQIRRHMDKGDPLDVAAYCAFAWHHGWTLAAPSAESALAAAQKRVGEVERIMGDMLAAHDIERALKSDMRAWADFTAQLLRAALAGKEPDNG